jgi:hypothetical protein
MLGYLLVVDFSNRFQRAFKIEPVSMWILLAMAIAAFIYVL